MPISTILGLESGTGHLGLRLQWIFTAYICVRGINNV